MKQYIPYYNSLQQAASLYIADTHPSNKQNQFQNYRFSKELGKEIYENEHLNPSLGPQSQINLNNSNVNNANRITNTNNTPRQQSLLSKIFSPIVSFVTSFCGERREVDQTEEERIFSAIPERIRNFNSFSTLLKTKIGILIVYTGTNLLQIQKFIQDLLNDSFTCDLIKQNCTVYTVLGTCTEGHRITSLISDNLLYPVIFFAYNDRGNSTFNRASIAQRLEGDFNVETFKNTLLNVIEMKQTHKRNPIQVSNAEIIEQQKRDLENLEKIEQMKRQQEKEEKEKERLAKLEEEQKEKEIQIKAQQAKSKLPDEPSKDDPNVTLIVFRYPDGEKRIERRFVKTNTVQTLYDFVLTLGRDIYTEAEYNKFSLIQPFPFKAYTDMNKTLEEEHLVPNAVLQIKEEDE